VLWAEGAKGASFVETGNMGSGRFVGTATLLTNGQVLLAGGLGGSPILSTVASAEIYDPATRSCSFVGSMSVPRGAHRAVLLANGKVLVAAGENDFTNLPSAELYDPFTRSWTNTGSLAVARFNHEMISLRNGKVLVVGGFDDAGNPLLSAELYDPGNGLWSSAGAIAGAATASALLSDGKVLLLE